MLTKIRSLLLPVALLSSLGLVLTGCGRKGDLDVPGAPPTARTDTGFNSNTSTTPKPKPKVEERPFILDAIL
jgi:predicted small lipoprotein YifL